MMFRRLAYVMIVLTALLSATNLFAVETAEQILEKCASKINKAPSIDLKFTVASGAEKLNCELIISREKYRLSSSELEVWFDGKTQWAYSPQNKEVSITEPTVEELLESNPFAIINNYKSEYSFRRLAGDKNEIELVAKNKMSSIRKAVITIDGKTYLPSKLILTLSNGRSLSATVTSASEGKALPSSTFIYNKDKYPATTLIDLR